MAENISKIPINVNHVKTGTIGTDGSTITIPTTFTASGYIITVASTLNAGSNRAIVSASSIINGHVEFRLYDADHIRFIFSEDSLKISYNTKNVTISTNSTSFMFNAEYAYVVWS